MGGCELRAGKGVDPGSTDWPQKGWNEGHPCRMPKAMGHEGFSEAGPLLDSEILLAIVFLFFLFKEE